MGNELPESTSVEAQELIQSVEDYEEMVGECKNYDPEFLNFYEHNHPEQAQQLNALLQEDLHSSVDFNLETDAALADLDATLWEYEQAVMASQTSEQENDVDQTLEQDMRSPAEQMKDKLAGLGLTDRNFQGLLEMVINRNDGYGSPYSNSELIAPGHSSSLDLDREIARNIQANFSEGSNGFSSSKLFESTQSALTSSNSNNIRWHKQAYDFLYTKGQLLAKERAQIAEGKEAVSKQRLEMDALFPTAMNNLETWEMAHPGRENAETGMTLPRKMLDDAYASFTRSERSNDLTGMKSSMEEFKKTADTLQRFVDAQKAISEWDATVVADLADIATKDAGQAEALRLGYQSMVQNDNAQGIRAMGGTIHDAWKTYFPEKASDRPDPRASNPEAPAPSAPARAPVARDYAPEQAQKTFRERLGGNQSAETKDVQKPSFDLVENNGVKEVTLHLPTPQDVRDSRITDFVGTEGLAVKLTAEELAKTSLSLLAEDHGQKVETVYTFKDGTWKSPEGKRLKVYDGTKVAVKTEKTAPAEPVKPPEPQVQVMDQKTFETQKPTGPVQLVQEGTYGEGGRPVTRKVEGTTVNGEFVGEVKLTNTTTNPDGTTHTAEKTITIEAPIDPKQFDWQAIEEAENPIDIPDNRTPEQRTASFVREYGELVQDHDSESAENKGVLPESMIARYEAYQERLTAFKATVADKPELLAQLAAAEKGTADVLAQVAKARAGAETEE